MMKLVMSYPVWLTTVSVRVSVYKLVILGRIVLETYDPSTL